MTVLKSYQFWKAVDVLLVALVATFAPQYGDIAVKVGSVLFAVLLAFGIVPELENRGLM